MAVCARDRPDRFAKAMQGGADAVIIDLEDAVSAPAKDDARAAVAGCLAEGKSAFVRINGPETPWHAAELAALAGTRVAGVMVPKADDPAVPAQVAATFSPDTARLVPLIETAHGLHRAAELARAPGVLRLAFGSVDFCLDTAVDAAGPALDHAGFSSPWQAGSPRSPRPSTGHGELEEDPAALERAFSGHSVWASAESCASIRDRSRRRTRPFRPPTRRSSAPAGS